MSDSNAGEHFRNLESRTTEETFYFFLERLLKARIELHIETGGDDYDQEMNMYIAGLLESLILTGDPFRTRPWISPFDTEVRTWLRDHPGLRSEYQVYKENADFSLLASGVFGGVRHEGSYHRRVFSDKTNLGRIGCYYKLAASALMHLRGSRQPLIHVYYALARSLYDLLPIMRKVATDYFDLVERMSEGSLYHLNVELDSVARKREFKRELDAFLEEYATYLDRPDEAKKEKLRATVGRLKELNPEFSFGRAL